MDDQPNPKEPTMSGMDNEEPAGWRRLLHADPADLAEVMTIARLSAITGLSRSGISRQLGRDRWNIAPVKRNIGRGGAQLYPLAPILEHAAGPGKGNRTSGDVRRQAALRRVASVLTTGFVAPALQALGQDPHAHVFDVDRC
jgi:hypothetical protein